MKPIGSKLKERNAQTNLIAKHWNTDREFEGIYVCLIEFTLYTKWVW